MVMTVHDAAQEWSSLDGSTPVVVRMQRAANLVEALLHAGSSDLAAEFASGLRASMLPDPDHWTHDELRAAAYFDAWTAAAEYGLALTLPPADAPNHRERAKARANDAMARIEAAFSGRDTYQLDVAQAIQLLTEMPEKRADEAVAAYDAVIVFVGEDHPVLGYLALETLVTAGHREQARTVADDDRFQWERVWSDPTHPIRRRYTVIADGPEIGIALWHSVRPVPPSPLPTVPSKAAAEGRRSLSRRYERAIEQIHAALAVGDTDAAMQASTNALGPVDEPEEARYRECLSWMFLAEVAQCLDRRLNHDTLADIDRLQTELLAAFPDPESAPPIACAALALTTIMLAPSRNDAEVRRNTLIREAGEDFLRANPFLHVLAISAVDCAGFPDLARALRDADMGYYETIWPELTHPLRNRLALAGCDLQPPAPPAAIAAGTPTPKPSAREQLDALTGLDDVKAHIAKLAKNLRTQQLRADCGLTAVDVGGHHLVFTGNPGTGKTTVARLIGQLYHELGLLERGHVVELGRAGLTGQYIGQTEQKTKEALQSALGGVLFIDEAYALNPGDSTRDFGARAIDEIVQFASGHAGELVIILAGYPKEMQELLEVNPGLQSRFRRTFTFHDYTSKELLQVIEREAESSDYAFTPEALASIEATLDALPRDRNFGNVRDALIVFQRAVEAHGARIDDVEDPTPDALRTILPEDVPAAHDIVPGLAPTPPAERDQGHGIYL